MFGIVIGLAIGVAALAGAAAVALGAITSHNRLAPPSQGAAGTVVGARGVVKDAAGMAGQVMVEGARWQAVAYVPLAVGMQVRVVGIDGLTILVEPADRWDS